MTPALRIILMGGSALPRLDLNFSQGTFLLNGARYSAVTSLPGFTFTRATPATAYAETLGGQLIPFAANVPRIPDKGLLVEEAGTNLALRSQEFDNASWSKFNSTVSPNAISGPDGTVTADGILADSTASTDHIIQQPTITVAASTNSMATFIVKPGAVSWAYISVFNQASVGVRRYFQLTGAGTVGSADNFSGTDAATPTIRALADGWYVITLALTGTGAQSSVSFRVGSANADLGRTYAAANTTSPQIYVWYGGLQVGTTPTSPVITTTASVTRAADSDTLATTIPAGDVTIFGQASTGRSIAATRTLMDWNDGGDTNKIVVSLNSSNQLVAVVTNASSATTIATETGSPSAARTIKWALAYTGGVWSLYLNGALVGSGAAAKPVVTSMATGHSRAVAAHFNDYIQRAAVRDGASGAIALTQ